MRARAHPIRFNHFAALAVKPPRFYEHYLPGAWFHRGPHRYI